MNKESLGLDITLLTNDIPPIGSITNPICPIFVGIAGFVLNLDFIELLGDQHQAKLLYVIQSCQNLAKIIVF